MTLRKKIVFEGQDVGLSSTMQKLQRQAEDMSTKILSRYSESVKSSKELNKLMEEEFNNNRRLSQLSFDDKRLQAIERYSKKLEEINKKEDAYYNKLKTSGLRGAALEDKMGEASQRFGQQRTAASTVKDETVTKLKESLDEQKRTNQLLTQIYSEDKKQWEQEYRENKKGVENFLSESKSKGLENLTEDERNKYNYQKLLSSETQQQQPRRGSVLRDVIGAGLIRDLGGVVSQFPNASDAYDLVPGLARITGAAGGATLGAGVGALAGSLSLTPDPGKGAIAGATFGAEVGQRAGDFSGAALMRHFNNQEALQRSAYGLKAITGLYPGQENDFSKFGVDQSEALQIAQQMARSTGSSMNDLPSLLGAQTGYGIEQGTLMSRARATRRTGGEFGSEISNLIGTAEGAGIDRVLFNEMIQNQSQLIESLGSMTEKVDPKNMTALMLELNNLSGGSGGFSMRDPRTMGMIGGLQSGLTSPNEFGRAMNLTTLRKMNPGGSLLDLLEMEEQGLGGEQGREFLKNTVSQYKDMFGDEDLAILSLRGRFPGIPIADLRKLIRGQDVLGSMETGEMTASADVTGQGNVAMRAQLQAAVTDAFATGPIEGLMKVEEQLGELFARVLEHASSKMNVEGMLDDAVNKAKNIFSRSSEPD